ncbi:MAG: DUF2130 domain-containing protein [Syntrophorhabdaceae bacterium]|nr:DUF2130 domain-containing protein [Syntrophorhabdaceae bacterium]
MVESVTKIICPYCRREIALDEVLTHQIKEQFEKEFNEQLAIKEQELKTKESVIIKREKELVRAKEEQEKEMERLREKLEKDLQTKLIEEKKGLEEAVRKKIMEESEVELNALKNELEEKKNKIREFQKIELTLREEKRRLEEEKQNMEIEVTRKLDAERTKIKEEALKLAYEQYRLKDVEKDRHIEALKNQIEELKRKVEQGPGDTGEALEWVLETELKSHFRYDIIEPVPRGVRGADVLHKVCTRDGQICGMIIWESKRVKNWSDGWIDKLKEDQREARADIAVLVSTVLPKGVSGITNINGVWVADYTLATGLAMALRYGLIQVAQAKVSAEGKSEKLEMLYSYLSGMEFRQQIEGIVEAFVSMKQDLEGEKRSMEKIWAKREKQIEKVIKNTTRMYGSLQGIIGSTLPELKTMELKALEGE